MDGYLSAKACLVALHYIALVLRYKLVISGKKVKGKEASPSSFFVLFGGQSVRVIFD